MPAGKIIVISGPSGVGKKSLITKIMANPLFAFEYSVSMTTRKPRYNERNGLDYYFVNEQEFNQAIANNELLEWAEYANNKYGTPLKNVQAQLAAGKNVILEIETVGMMNVKKLFPRDVYLTFFIKPPSLEELQKRLEARNADSVAIINTRLAKAKEELTMENHYDHVLVNDQLENTYEKICAILSNYFHS